MKRALIGLALGLLATSAWSQNAVTGKALYLNTNGAPLSCGSGSPWNIQAGQDVNGDTNNVDRPTINGIHVERNSERQPDYWTVDLRIGKPFQIGDFGDVLIFAECFNCTDVANWSIPTSNMSWGSANRSTPASANFGQETTPGTPRTFQFGIRFDF